MMNQVILIGNLVRDPELKYIPSGKAVANFTIAVNRNWKGPNGEKREEVGFFECECWGRVAETVAAHVKKGKRILADGRLVQERWQGNDGKNHSVVRVSCSRVLFLSPRDSTATADQDVEGTPEVAPVD